MSELTRPKMGTWHTIKNEADRMERGVYRWWEAAEIDPCRAMYIGYRHKRNGTYQVAGAGFDHYDMEPYTFDAYLAISETVEVWLFVIDDRKNPIPVMPFEWEQPEEMTFSDYMVSANIAEEEGQDYE